MKYLEDWKNAIKGGITEKKKEGLIKSREEIESGIVPYNLYKRVQEIEDKVARNIEDIKNIYADIKDRILPSIEEAKTWSTQAVNAAQGIIDKLGKTATHLVGNVKNINRAASNLSGTIKGEVNTIKNTFVRFGNNVKGQIDALASSANYVGSELQEAVNEIKPALDASISWAKTAASRASRLQALRAVVAAHKSIAYLVHKGYGGQGAVIPEMMEGFTEIKNAFINLKNNFTAFGNKLKYESDVLGGQIKGSVNKISTKTTTLTNNISKMGKDLKQDLS